MTVSRHFLKDEVTAVSTSLHPSSFRLHPFKRLQAAVGVVRGGAGHLRRALYEAAADQDLDLDAAVLLAPLAGRVVGHRVRLAVAVGRDDAAQRDVVVLDEVAN